MTVKEVAAVSKGLVGAPELSFSRSENYCVSIVDMVDSTRIVAEVQDPIRIRDLYSMFVDGMSTIARRFGARVIKNMGDSIVVYFPNTTDTATASSFRDVIECGLAMIGNRCNLNNLFHEAELPSIGYRISADYGRLEVGNSRSSKEHDLFGSTMNLCSKINKIASPNSMVVGGDLYQILNRLPFFEYTYHQSNGYSLGFKHSYPVYQVASTWPHQRDKSDLSSIFPLRMNHLPKHPIRDPLPHELVAESLAGPQVLLVDDDPESLSSASDYLASSGLKVDSFTDPFTAAKRFAVADRAFYSLVIIDISMPLLNGLQLFQWLKTVVPEIKALFLSDYEVPSEFISVLPGIATEDIMVKPLARDPFVATTISKIKGNKSS